MESDEDCIARYQAKAEELRVRAETVNHPQSKETLLHLAADYDRMAAMARKRSGKGL